MSARTTPPVPCRPRGAACSGPPGCWRPGGLRGRRIPAEQLRATRTPRSPTWSGCRRASACNRPPTGEFRRASWHIGLHLPAGRDRPGAGKTCWSSSTTRRGHRSTPRPRCTSTARCTSTTRSSARISSTEVGGEHRRAQADHPVAQHGPLPGGPAMIDPAVYPDPESSGHLAAGYADEVARLAALLHVPAVRRHQPGLPERPRQRADRGPREDAEHLHLPLHQAASNAALAGAGGLAVTTHLLPGQLPVLLGRVPASYDFVAEALFRRGLNVDGFFLEFDDERSGGFGPLRFVPPGKMSCWACVTTNEVRWRTPTTSSGRIEEASRFVPLWSSCACPSVRLFFHRGRHPESPLSLRRVANRRT